MLIRKIFSRIIVGKINSIIRPNDKNIKNNKDNIQNKVIKL